MYRLRSRESSNQLEHGQQSRSTNPSALHRYRELTLVDKRFYHESIEAAKFPILWRSNTVAAQIRRRGDEVIDSHYEIADGKPTAELSWLASSST